MKYRFITIIHFLKLDKPACRIPLASGMVSNKADLLKDVLSYDNPLALNTLGVHSIDEFQNKPFYLVDGSFEEGITMADVDAFGISLTFAFLRQIQGLTDKLWMIRDNSVYVRDGFLFVYENVFRDGVTFKASLSTINSKASSVIEDTTFSREEIVALAEGMDVFPIEEVRSGKSFREPTQFQYFKSGKIGRKMTAWIYVFYARAAAALTIKVLMYITAMEALVSTSTAELSHQVSERVAVLLGKDAQERLSIYNDIKKGYGIRSKAAHGEPVRGTEADTAALLVTIDDYTRRLMALDTPYDLDQEKMNEFFMERLMGEYA